MRKICFGCGGEYSAIDNRQIYCGEKCRAESYYIKKVVRAGKEYRKRSPKDFMCWKCHHQATKISPKYYYCPNCGAKYEWAGSRINESIKE